MKRLLLIPLVLATSLNAQPIDWRDNLVYPTNPPQTAVPRSNADVQSKVLAALRAKTTQKPDSPEERFLEAYKTTQSGKKYSENQDQQKARECYLKALDNLRNISKEHSDWQPKVVQYRTEYVQKLLTNLPQ